MRNLACALFLLAGLSWTATATSHHGWSEYDASKTLTLTGTIRESGYEHPHGHIRLEVPGKTWQVVLAPLHAWRIAASPRHC